METALVVVVASLLLVGASVAAMAVGAMFRRGSLRGSCGGPEIRNARGEKLSCATCPNRKAHAADPSACSHSRGAADGPPSPP